MVRRPDGAPFGPGLPPARDAGERERYAEMAREADVAMEAPLRERLAETLALAGAAAEAPPVMEILAGTADAYLQPTVRSFEYDYGPLPSSVHFVGALLQPRGVHPTRPRWWDQLDVRPIVLLTQGTVANGDFDELINPALAALAGRGDLQVVVSTGGRWTTFRRLPVANLSSRPSSTSSS